jgi:glycosyltransferase involved in cell wall biosynthesis
MRVCVVAEYYPRRRDPVLGVWAHRQAVAARDAGADVRVLVLERPVPSAAVAREALEGRPRALLRAGRALAAQPRRDELDGIPVEYVRFVAPPRRGSYATWDRWARRPLRRALERLHRSRPLDLVHAHYALPAAAAARPFCRARGVPLVVSVHGGDVLGPALAATAARSRVRGVLLEAGAVLVNSRWTLERCAELTGTRRGLRVVHLGADPPAAPPPRRPEPTVVTLGHVVPRKRHGDVLRALRLLREELPALRYLVVGDGPERPALELLAMQLSVAERVEWAGQLAPAAALDALARCHLMALPSVDEAFGVAYVEALACGVPAIGCRGEGGPEEIAALGGGVLLVPPADVEALAGAVREALATEGAHHELSEAARRTAREHFTWARCGAATVAAYEDVMRA